MKTALITIDVSKKLNLFDYVAKVQNLQKNMGKYDEIYCLLNDLFIDESNYTANDMNLTILQNVQTLLNLGFDKNVKFILQSSQKNVYSLSNDLSRFMYVTKIIKNEYLKTSIQKISLNDIKLSSLINFSNLLASILLIGADDIYETRAFESFYDYASKIVALYNEVCGKNLSLPNLVINKELMYNNLSADGNSFIADKFDNDVALVLSGDELTKKINGIFTDPNHIKIEDAGSVENNPLFMFVDCICSDQDVKEFFGFNTLQELKNHYQMGGVGDYKIKQMLKSAFVKKFSCCSTPVDIKKIEERLSNDIK